MMCQVDTGAYVSLLDPGREIHYFWQRWEVFVVQTLTTENRFLSTC